MKEFKEPVLSREDEFTERRNSMVDSQLKKRGIKNSRLLSAFNIVPRHLFVPPESRDDAYKDNPLPIGLNQTISQPYIVAYMIDQLELSPTDRVLEIGTGSGFQTALLAELSSQVFTVEIIPELSKKAEKLLKQINYQNVSYKIGDGHAGWGKEAPFDAIIVSAAPSRIPWELVRQMGPASRMIIPIGRKEQELVKLVNKNGYVEQLTKIPVRFVPMTRNI